MLARTCRSRIGIGIVVVAVVGEAMVGCSSSASSSKQSHPVSTSPTAASSRTRPSAAPVTITGGDGFTWEIRASSPATFHTEGAPNGQDFLVAMVTATNPQSDRAEPVASLLHDQVVPVYAVPTTWSGTYIESAVAATFCGAAYVPAGTCAVRGQILPGAVASGSEVAPHQSVTLTVSGGPGAVTSAEDVATVRLFVPNQCPPGQTDPLACSLEVPLPPAR